MSDYERLVDLTLEVGAARSEYRSVSDAYFELREQHFAHSRWWTRSGAGSSHELVAQLHRELAGERQDLSDYWYFPSGKHNPYLDLLYSAMPASGYRPRELASLDDVMGLDSGSVLHIHWIESLRPNGTDGDANRSALERARRLVDAFVGDPRNRLIWSVHEPLPHESKWPDHDAEFHQYLADTAHAIHVLHESTAEACAPHFSLDTSKMFEVPLPLYSGVYPDYRSRESARALLGLRPDELAVVALGALRPYKGLDELVDAAVEVSERRPLSLLMCGLPVGDVNELLDASARYEQVRIAPMLVPDSEIQTVLRAADVAAIPYRRFLNSAVLMLALSFGVPVIATDNPVTGSAKASGLVTTYTNLQELVEGLTRCDIDPQRSIDHGFAQARAPLSIATLFAESVVPLLEGI